MSPQLRRRLMKAGTYLSAMAFGAACAADGMEQFILFAIAAVLYLVVVLAPACTRARSLAASGTPVWGRPNPKRVASSFGVLAVLFAVAHVIGADRAVLVGLCWGIASVAIIQVAAVTAPRPRPGDTAH